MFLGKLKGFGQRFDPPRASPYLEHLVPLCGEYRRSPVTLSLIRDDIRGFNRKPTPKPQDPLLEDAIRQAFRAFHLPQKQKMLHLNDVFQKESNIWNASPGLPWIMHGYKQKKDIQRDPDAIKRVRWFWHRVKARESISFPDCCAYVRAQVVRKGETKVRAVWGYPATITFGEAVFAVPLLEAYQKTTSPFAYGYETGTGGCSRIRREFNAKHYLGVDFTGFDKSCPTWLIDAAFDVLAYNIDFGNYQDHGVARYSDMIHMFNRIRDYCKRTPIRLCNGERYLKTSGIASGSYFTQLAGSVANYIVLVYSALKADARIKSIKVLGDDSIIATEHHFTPEDVQKAVAPFGMIVNVAKSGYSTNLDSIKFLGYRINEGKPVREVDKAFAGLVFPERPDREWDDVASRALGILYANLGVDKVIDFWCREVVNFRPFTLQLSRGQQRYLDMLKMTPSSTAPTRLEFLRRIGYI